MNSFQKEFNITKLLNEISNNFLSEVTKFKVVIYSLSKPFQIIIEFKQNYLFITKTLRMHYSDISMELSSLKDSTDFKLLNHIDNKFLKFTAESIEQRFIIQKLLQLNQTYNQNNFFISDISGKILNNQMEIDLLLQKMFNDRFGKLRFQIYTKNFKFINCNATLDKSRLYLDIEHYSIIAITLTTNFECYQNKNNSSIIHLVINTNKSKESIITFRCPNSNFGEFVNKILNLFIKNFAKNTIIDSNQEFISNDFFMNNIPDIPSFAIEKIVYSSKKTDDGNFSIFYTNYIEEEQEKQNQKQQKQQKDKTLFKEKSHYLEKEFSIIKNNDQQSKKKQIVDISVLSRKKIYGKLPDEPVLFEEENFLKMTKFCVSLVGKKSNQFMEDLDIYFSKFAITLIGLNYHSSVHLILKQFTLFEKKDDPKILQIVFNQGKKKLFQFKNEKDKIRFVQIYRICRENKVEKEKLTKLEKYFPLNIIFQEKEYIGTVILGEKRILIRIPNLTRIIQYESIKKQSDFKNRNHFFWKILSEEEEKEKEEFQFKFYSEFQKKLFTSLWNQKIQNLQPKVKKTYIQIEPQESLPLANEYPALIFDKQTYLMKECVIILQRNRFKIRMGNQQELIHFINQNWNIIIKKNNNLQIKIIFEENEFKLIFRSLETQEEFLRNFEDSKSKAHLFIQENQEKELDQENEIDLEEDQLIKFDKSLKKSKSSLQVTFQDRTDDSDITQTEVEPSGLVKTDIEKTDAISELELTEIDLSKFQF
ncbi:hypothetical protein M0811_01846 [Anaeramoeba ignava]|uniref:Uncharacterized protein n=1 Tax=Anaeramoeba ignava TaxID=1746090 RepID=A0A9Q0LGL8_ANAIG|nr:hypothetical protein M0811_01846 [Anaeramoeba ignava]